MGLININDSEILEIRMGKKIEVSFLEQNKLKFRKDIYAKKNNEIIAFGYIENNFFLCAEYQVLLILNLPQALKLLKI